MNFIIGISGKPGSGKDFLANMFVNKARHFTRISLADSIRSVVQVVTGLSMDSMRSHPEKDKPLEKYNGRSARQLTIETASAIESVYGLEVWSAILERRIRDQGLANIIVPDIRTLQQAQWVLDQPKGMLIRLESPSSNKPEHPIECLLDHYNFWSYVIHVSQFRQDSSAEFKKLCSTLEIATY